VREREGERERERERDNEKDRGERSELNDREHNIK
jgi:hypothetical protein